MAIVREMKQACRSLLRAPGFSLVVLSTFALGIGGSTAIFSLVRGVLLRALPFPHEEQLAMVWETRPAVLACVLPAIRAARVQPASVLREE